MPSLSNKHNDSLMVAGVAMMGGYFLAAMTLLGQYLGSL